MAAIGFFTVVALIAVVLVSAAVDVPSELVLPMIVLAALAFRSLKHPRRGQGTAFRCGTQGRRERPPRARIRRARGRRAYSRPLRVRTCTRNRARATPSRRTGPTRRRPSWRQAGPGYPG